MSTAYSTYYGLTRIRDMGPEAKDWVTTDHNVELTSLILKALEQHVHGASTTLNHPGYYVVPDAPTVTPQGTPGTTSYSYYVVATGTQDKESEVGTTTSGHATLDSSNYNRITWTTVAGATGYDVIRTLGGATQGVIATGLSSGTTQYDDQGDTASTYTPARQPALTSAAGGVLRPGTSISIRTSYVNNLGLETAASPESFIDLPAPVERPLTPDLVSTQVADPGLPGGTYIYALTKKKDSGETTISDVLPVEIQYDDTYSVTIEFDAIETYSDGTDAINIYRSGGLNSAFQLVTTITGASTTQFIDTNQISGENANVQPPTVGTFDATYKVNIDWSALSHPGEAKFLRIYATQQTGLWSTSHLLSEIDLTDSPPDSIDYLGNEPLSIGWPLEVSRIPASPPLLDLTTEATGAPILTEDMNFGGYEALDFKLENRSGAPTAEDGRVYYDTSLNMIRAYINGTWTDWGNSSTDSYSHPAEEVGGHIAANLLFKTAGTSLKTILDRTNDTSGNRKQVTKIARTTATTSGPTFSGTSFALIPQMSLTAQADFANQWVEIVFHGHFTLDNFAATANFAIEYDSVTQDETIDGFTSNVAGQNFSVQISWAKQLPDTNTHTFKILWLTSGSPVRNVTLRRYMYYKVLY